MEEDRIPKQVLSWTLQVGKRGINWIATICKDLEEIDMIWEEAARDRNICRSCVAGHRYGTDCLDHKDVPL